MTQAFSLEAFIFVIILLIYLLTSHIIQTKKLAYIHESTVAIFMGIMTAIFAKYGLGQQISFSDDLFFAIILPPLVFSAGYNIRKSRFFQNLKIIGFLSIVGTIIGFICLTYFLIFINTYIFKALTLGQILLISSVLCATDPFTTMSLIKPKKYPVLNSVLFGQGIINDAVAIILFRTISDLKIENQFTFFTGLRIAFDFTYMFGFSVAFGSITGFGLTYLFIKLKLQKFLNHSLKQTSLILLNGYFTYLMGQLLGISGIISLFTCAVIMGKYCFMNISHQSQHGTGLAFDTVSYIAQAFVFAYLGASILSIQGNWLAVLMGIFVLVSMPVIRAIMVYSLPLFYKVIGRSFPLDQKQLKICWLSGMVRGAIAFALSLQIQSQDKKYIITISLVIVMTTTILSSTLLQNFMKKIGLSVSSEHNQEQEDIIGKKLKQQSFKSMPKSNISISQMQSNRPMILELQNFQQKFKKPIFINNQQPMFKKTSSVQQINQRAEKPKRLIQQI